MSGKSTKAETPEFWETEADKIECKCGMVYVRPKHSTPEEAAKEEWDVIEAADFLADEIEMADNVAPSQAEGELVAAVAALRASRQPKGVKPETLPLGARFWFAGGNVPYVCRIIEANVPCNPNSVLCFQEEDAPRVWAFTGDARIIPIDPEDS